MIRHNKTPEEAFRPFATFPYPFLPYRDASLGISTFNLGILDCLRSIYNAMSLGWYAPEKFDLEECVDYFSLTHQQNSPLTPPVFYTLRYQHFERVDNGDLNWIIPGKFLAFSGPVSVMSPTSPSRSEPSFTPTFTAVASAGRHFTPGTSACSPPH